MTLQETIRAWELCLIQRTDWFLGGLKRWWHYWKVMKGWERSLDGGSRSVCLSPWCCIWLLLVTFPLLPGIQDVRSTTLKHPPPGWIDASENINQSKASLSWTASVKCSSHNDEQVTIRAYLSSNQLERLGRGRWLLCLDEITGRREEEHGRECFTCTTYKLKSCLLSNINKCGKHYNKTAIIKN